MCDPLPPLNEMESALSVEGHHDLGTSTRFWGFPGEDLGLSCHALNASTGPRPTANLRVSKVKRWQERAQKLLEAVRGAVAAGTAASDGGGVGIAGGAGSLRQRVEACLSEPQADLKVSDVPEAVELSGFLQVRALLT